MGGSDARILVDTVDRALVCCRGKTFSALILEQLEFYYKFLRLFCRRVFTSKSTWPSPKILAESIL